MVRVEGTWYIVRVEGAWLWLKVHGCTLCSCEHTCAANLEGTLTFKNAAVLSMDFGRAQVSLTSAR